MTPPEQRPGYTGRKDEIIFTIYYNNGLFDECDGTLDEAKAMADECAGYTQCDISIEDENREEVARRRWYGVPRKSGRPGKGISSWYGVPFDPAETETDEADVIQFGNFGFFDRWE